MYLFTFNSNSSFPCGNAKINGNYIVCSTKLQIQQSGAHPFWIFFQPMLEFELRRKNSNFFFKCLPHHCWNKTSQKHFFIFISSYTIFGYLFISRFPAIYALIYLSKFLFDLFSNKESLLNLITDTSISCLWFIRLYFKKYMYLPSYSVHYNLGKKVEQIFIALHLLYFVW